MSAAEKVAEAKSNMRRIGLSLKSPEDAILAVVPRNQRKGPGVWEDGNDPEQTTFKENLRKNAALAYGVAGTAKMNRRLGKGPTATAGRRKRKTRRRKTRHRR